MSQNPLVIVADTPNSRPGLGFERYVRALGDAIRGVEPPQCTFGLYGSWGSGKSSLLAAIGIELSKDADILVVEFDAWRYERAQHIVVPLLHRVAQAAKSRAKFQAAGKQVARFVEALVSSLEYSRFGLRFVGDRLISRLKTGREALLDNEFSRPFEELKNVQGSLRGVRVVVLVDDLDRCSPAKVVDLLESLSLVTGVPGFVFVLALDYDVLVSAVSQKYPHVSGHAFVEKMIQVPFRVPVADTSDRTFLRDVVPNWAGFVATHGEEVRGSLAEVSEIALGANPRQVKRLVNAYVLIDRILGSAPRATTKRELLALLGLQLAWPSEYGELQEAILLGDPDPFGFLRESPDARLSRFASAFFLDVKPDLAEVVRLASAVEAPTPSPNQAFNQSGERLLARSQVIESLHELGWYQTALGSDRKWRHPMHPGLEVHFAKASFRLHKRFAIEGEQRMLSIGSFLFAKSDEGLAYIADVMHGKPARAPKPRKQKSVPLVQE